ncbi:hypothetical protein [Emticicia sp. TH156]|uniref:hypothetical protein n=1 Tax=Emticicia sp. TH156 TaxID=2067454 RepID=UPI000C764DDA|nr:hypothetical protein [Emticicia sp. TH156]PLK46178.1 hypothetical protein C0V77_02180 [Emticicia sp. TH156]
MKYPIFSEKPLKKASFAQRFLKQKPLENALIEVNNLFANKDVGEITKNEIELISVKYKINILRDFSLNMEEFYAVILNYNLQDRKLTKNEIADLEHIKFILELDEKNIETISHLLGKSIYKKSFEEAIEDGRLSERDKQFLLELEVTLNLPKEMVNDIYKNVTESFFEKLYTKIIKDHRVSPEEENEILQVAQSLNITISNNVKSTIKRLKEYWSYENLGLQIVTTSHKIQKNEYCYYLIENSSWFEERESLKKIYKYSKINMQNEISSQNLKFIDRGAILLTNKRIVFIGIEKTSSIHLEKILNTNKYKDGIEIDKLTGRSPIFKINEDSTIFEIILNRLITGRY